MGRLVAQRQRDTKIDIVHAHTHRDDDGCPEPWIAFDKPGATLGVQAHIEFGDPVVVEFSGDLLAKPQQFGVYDVLKPTTSLITEFLHCPRPDVSMLCKDSEHQIIDGDKGLDEKWIGATGSMVGHIVLQGGE